ncbi:MAG TPA: BamA/TamA family outer membrane protein [Bacteroidales bacterium]|nr:BamA/TamA family outer membrane protein [Bacteroidales bacterium]
MKNERTIGGFAITVIFIFFITLTLAKPAMAQDDDPQPEREPKTGWRLGGLLPTITFDSDLGFQYGALVNIFNYGDGSRFPRYDHSLYFEISRFTRGSGNHRFFYDSDQLVRGIRTTFDLTYITDPLMSFHGFNGHESSFHPGFIDEELTDPQFAYRSRAFYAHDRKMFRTKLDLQGALAGENLRWVSGFELYNFAIGSVNEAKLNEKLDPEDHLPDVPGLYDLYKQWGFIEPGEANGGWVNYLKAGISYDTRDNEPNPMRGVWSEVVLVVAPNFMVTGDYGHAKLSVTHRQYFTLIENDLSFAYRLGFQQTVAGRAPFYIQPLVVTSFLRSINSEGLGGSRTLRGIRRNRVVGDGFAMGNFELRWKFARFNIGATNVYLGLNGFFDAGRVIDPIDINLDAVPPAERALHFDRDGERVHMTAGAGFRVAINENFIVAADFGRAFDERDGGSGLYIGLNYLF